MIRKRGLGRGLDVLLGAASAAATAAAPVAASPAVGEDPAVNSTPPGVPNSRADGELCHLPVDVIERGRYQPRIDMHPDTLEQLAASIRAQGIVQPVVVRPLAVSGRFELIAGERRWRAAQMAGLHEIPAIIKAVPDEAALAMALIENIQREGLNPLEEATALHRLCNEFALTHQEVADAVGRSRTAVTNLLRLLELGDEVKRLLEQGELEMGHARALLALSGSLQAETAHKVVAKGLSVRQTEQLIRQLFEAQEAKPATVKEVDPNIRHLQLQIAERLGAAVTIHHSTRGKGTLTIAYNSLDELDGILAHIK